jgi:hypothetical protein
MQCLGCRCGDNAHATVVGKVLDHVERRTLLDRLAETPIKHDARSRIEELIAFEFAELP